MQSDFLPISQKRENHEFSVSEISNKIKQLLETNLGFVHIKGEVSGLKIASSGHYYFSLKDDKAVISAICWRGVASKLKFKLTDGFEVVVSGKITAYGGQSKYQISVDSIRPSGDGAFMQILTERKRKLQAEGLFAAAHKKKIPFLPQKIGIVTSMSGAVIRDIIHRINDRCKTSIVIWPVSVQGNNSAEEVSSAIEGFNEITPNNRPDLLIIARGGGSIEDLWSFNEEIVVRAAFNSKIPLISAIGHETDYTLLDLVADLRAPTPTAAAEFSVPVARDLIYTLGNLEKTLTTRLGELIKHYNQKILISNGSIFSNMKNLVRFYYQRTDELGFRFYKSMPNMIRNSSFFLNKFSLSRFQIHKTLEYKFLQYNNLSKILLREQQNLFSNYENKLAVYSSILSSADYKKILQRGYVIAMDENENIISDTKNLPIDRNFYLKMRDGKQKVKSIV